MLLGSIDAIGVMLTERERGGCFVKARRMFIYRRLCKFTCHCRNNNAYECYRTFL